MLDSEGTALRLGVEAEPHLVSPNQHEAESLVGQEFSDEEDFAMALETIAEMGPRNVLISHEGGCYALLKEERKLRRYRASISRIEPVSPVGSGDVLLAGFLAARRAGRSLEEALCQAVGAATASTLETGAGRFDSGAGERVRAPGRDQRAAARRRSIAKLHGESLRPALSILVSCATSSVGA